MPPQTVPFYDPASTPSTWCGRMSPDEIAGPAFKGGTGLSPRYLRVLGLSLLSVGVVLFATDWINDFRFGLPGFIRARLLIFGVLVTAIASLSRPNDFQKSRTR